MTVGWINREEFGVADGGGGRFVGEDMLVQQPSG